MSEQQQVVDLKAAFLAETKAPAPAPEAEAASEPAKETPTVEATAEAAPAEDTTPGGSEPAKEEVKESFAAKVARERESFRQQRAAKEQQKRLAELEAEVALSKKDPIAYARKLGLDSRRLMEAEIGIESTPEEKPLTAKDVEDRARELITKEVGSLRWELFETKERQRIESEIRKNADEFDVLAAELDDDPSIIDEMFAVGIEEARSTGQDPDYSKIFNIANKILAEKIEQKISKWKKLKRFLDKQEQPVASKPTLVNNMAAEQSNQVSKKVSTQDLRDAFYADIGAKKQ